MSDYIVCSWCGKSVPSKQGIWPSSAKGFLGFGINLSGKVYCCKRCKVEAEAIEESNSQSNQSREFENSKQIKKPSRSNEYSDEPSEIIQQPKTVEQILAEAEAAKIKHQIDIEEAAEVEESDKKFYASIKKYWYVWVTLIVVIAIGIVYTTFKTANEKKEAANMSLQLEQIEDQIKLAIQDGNKEQALELANKLILPIHAIYEDKGGILSTVYYDTYWNDKRDEYKKIIMDMKQIDKNEQLGTIVEQELETERAEKLKGEESGKLLAYFTKNNVTPAPTASGVYIITQNSGVGRTIVKTDFVTMDLTVSSIEGVKIFSTLDRNRPIIFEFGQPFDTKGFDEAIATMRKGSKATVIVPSAMGVGDKGKKDQNGYETIPPYSPIVYEIEVLDIKTQAEGEKAKKLEETNAKKSF